MRSRGRRLRWLRVGVGVCVLLTATSVTGCRDSRGESRPERGGPMVVNNRQGSALTRPLGSKFTEGVQVLFLEGKDAATITSVDLVGDPGIKLLGALVLPPPRALGAFQFLDQWPPEQMDGVDFSTVVPAVGARVGTQAETDEGWELLLGIGVDQEGYLSRRQIRVGYVVDGIDYYVDLPTELAICTDKRFEKNGRCPFVDSNK